MRKHPPVCCSGMCGCCRRAMRWRACLAACLEAAATGQPERERWQCRDWLTWPRPEHPGVGHLTMVSCAARTVPHVRHFHVLSYTTLCSRLHNSYTLLTLLYAGKTLLISLKYFFLCYVMFMRCWTYLHSPKHPLHAILSISKLF